MVKHFSKILESEEKATTIEFKACHCCMEGMTDKEKVL